VHNDVPYGDDYRWDRCYDGVPENMSTACAAHFLNEACFYECDVHVGKWRRHDDCKDDAGADNAWQIAGMPIKKSECDQFYQDCKDDLFCVSNESKSFFALPTCNHDTQCQTFGSIYTGGKEMCELLWDHSFKYEPVEANAYTWSFAEGAANPNNGILPSVSFPEKCPFHEPDLSECGVQRATAIQGAHINMIQNEIDGDENCDVCHLRGAHKDVSSPTAFGAGAMCGQYRDNSCCTPETAVAYVLPNPHANLGCVVLCAPQLTAGSFACPQLRWRLALGSLLR
jgi:hypothetical protein